MTTTQQTGIDAINNTYLNGITAQKEPFTSKNGKNFTSVGFQYLSNGQKRWTDLVAFGELAGELAAVAPGTFLEIEGSLDYTESKGRRYQRVVLSKIDSTREIEF